MVCGAAGRVHISASCQVMAARVTHSLFPPLRLIVGAFVDSLATLVESILPRVSAISSRAVRALIAARGSVPNANRFAEALGLRNRDQLRRILIADGLPCLQDLAGWVRLLGWALDAEKLGVGLSRSALEDGKDPRSGYRTVRRLTGKSWTEVRALGSDAVLMMFLSALENCKNRTHTVKCGVARRA